MSTDFCFIEKDSKTYSYVLRFIEFLKNSKETTLSLDNRIQAEEMQLHLDGLQIKKENYDRKNMEIANWVKKNAKPFRNYLNSVKIVAMVLYSVDNHCDSNCSGKRLSFENFCKVVDDINGVKIRLIDTVF